MYNLNSLKYFSILDQDLGDSVDVGKSKGSFEEAISLIRGVETVEDFLKAVAEPKKIPNRRKDV